MELEHLRAVSQQELSMERARAGEARVCASDVVFKVEQLGCSPKQYEMLA
jgi:hypothetical protein